RMPAQPGDTTEFFDIPQVLLGPVLQGLALRHYSTSLKETRMNVERIGVFGLPALLAGVLALPTQAFAAPPLSGAIFTTNVNGTAVNGNIYAAKCDVYLDGGPAANAPQTAAG